MYWVKYAVGFFVFLFFLQTTYIFIAHFSQKKIYWLAMYCTGHMMINNNNIIVELQNWRASQCPVKPFRVEAGVQWHEESRVSKGLGCALQLRCLHRLYLIPACHGKMVAPETANTLALAFTSISVAPKTRNMGLEEKQNGTWLWAESREGRGKHERETSATTCVASFLRWIWKSGVGWLQILSLVGKKRTEWWMLMYSTGFHYRIGEWNDWLWPRH